MKYEHLPALADRLVRMKLVVLSGAGISKESGLDTFRDRDGLWSKIDCSQFATPEGFDAHPKDVLDFYNDLRLWVHAAQPNHAHRLLAELEQWHDVCIITQNVDDLHERAGSKHVIHMHGDLRKVTSSRNRLDPASIREWPLDVPIRLGDLAADGSQLRPCVVWFGEYLSGTDAIYEQVRNADIFLVIGTSLTIAPASRLIEHTHPAIPKFAINLEEVPVPENVEFIKATATAGIDIFVDRIIELTRSDAPEA